MLHNLKKAFHILEALVAEILFGFPCRKLKVIGVTGTDGKTTTSHLIYHILKSSGHKVAMISSVYADTGGKINDTGFHTTTPRPYMVRKYLSQAVKNKCKYFVLETTSHALDQGRVWGIPFESSIITNVTHEHMLHHKTFDNYLKIKCKLLLQSKVPYVNMDAKAYNRIKSQLLIHHKSFKTFSVRNKKADYVWPNKLTTKLQGEYNRQNIMGAYAVVSSMGISESEIFASIKSFQLPKGRYDMVYNKRFTVIIDFAHTPNSIAEVLKTVRSSYIKNKGQSLIHVFGSASERDDSKRPMMGVSSAKYADKIVLTEEDHRHEDVNKIFAEIEKGIVKEGFKFYEKDAFAPLSKAKTYTKISNRADAIDTAVSMLKNGDVFIATGKGHESSLNRNGVEESWSEHDAVKASLKKRFSIII